MPFDPQEIRENFHSTPCAVCHAAVGATSVFKILDRTINFMASAEGITVAEQEIVRPAVQQAIENYQHKKRKKKDGA